MTEHSPKPVRGLLFGAIAGATAAWAMNQFQELLRKTTPKPRRYTSVEKEPPAEDATMKAADRIARRIHLHPLSPQQKAKAGPVVHYAFGTAVGALYGLTAEYFPKTSAGFGTLLEL